MSAHSAQRKITRWRCWRMGRDIASRKDRDGRMSGSHQAQVVDGDHALRIGSLVPLLLLLSKAHTNTFTHARERELDMLVCIRREAVHLLSRAGYLSSSVQCS